MCTRNHAEEILHSVYAACSPIFGRIHDSYVRGDFTPESDIGKRCISVRGERLRIRRH